jgi:mannitol PTS system EIICBA or EIICB component
MSATPYTPPVYGTGLRARIQRFGGYLAGMVMPNIAAFIAWGLITAFFIPTGWTPNEGIGKLVSPMILTLLPILIGYTGGRLVHGQRGGVVGAVATVGLVVGADVPMFLGAMIIGPLTAYLLKLFDGLIEGKVRPGFEMLVDNFSAGIIGGGMAIAGLYAIGPVVRNLTEWAGNGVDWMISNHLLPLVSVLVEPAKILFLNNAINHGVLGPLGVTEAAEKGKSILFMIPAPDGAGRDDHPVSGRDPRAVLPVRPDEAAARARGHRRWRGRRRHLHDHGRWSGGHAVAGQHLRVRCRDPEGWLVRCVPRRGDRRGRLLCRRVLAARLRAARL